MASKVSFPPRVTAADGVGFLLAEALWDSQRDRVVLVAHSLGCRVALSTIAKLDHWAKNAHRAGRPPRMHVVLMAAAVPVPDCAGRGRYAQEPHFARCSVMYSPLDGVLGKVFPLGQAFVDRHAEAVGLRGHPEAGRWHARLRTPNGHGDYWGSPETARQVLGVLAYDELRRAGSRSFARLPRVEPEPPAAGRVLPRRPLAVRSMTSGSGTTKGGTTDRPR
jgi:hypothetical protein